MEIKTSSRVKLISYEGVIDPPTPGEPDQNYWRLLGWEGVVIKDPFTCAKYPDKALGTERRVLVKFDLLMSSLNLLSSDAAENSLWVAVTDLLRI